MPDNEIEIRGAKNCKVEVTGGNKHIGSASQISQYSNSKQSTHIKITDIEGGIIDVVGLNRFEGPNDFQAAIFSLSEIFSKALDTYQAQIANDTLREIENEKKNSRPNINRVKSLIDTLLKLIPLAKITISSQDKILQIINFLKDSFHIA